MHTDDQLITGRLLEVTREPIWTWLPWTLAAALFVIPRSDDANQGG
jgi:hypothetical protein